MYVRMAPRVASRTLRGLGAAIGNALRNGGQYVFTFQSVSFTIQPTTYTLTARLANIPGVSVRHIEWTGGLFGLFGGNLTVTIVWSGAAGVSADVIGQKLADAMSVGLVGTFIYSDASGQFAEAGSDSGSQNPPPPAAPKSSDVPWATIFVGGVGAVAAVIALR